jgi:hypothetical protein
MKVLVCGSRDWRDGTPIRMALSELPRDATILHGGARGADRLAGNIAASFGFHVEQFPADWGNRGRRAGIERNLQMLDEKPDLVLAFHLNDSVGTAHTVREARKRGIPVRRFTLPTKGT